MSFEKLRPSFTFTEDRLRELQQVVPEAFADGKINWDTLREALGEHLEDEEQEHFGLTWPGKREARRLAAMPSKGTLVPVPGEGVNEESTHNIFIEGDNLEVLKLLQKSYAGRVKMIYIDPPYNTGNDFVYPDDYSEPLEAYLERIGQMDDDGKMLSTNRQASGRYHTNWLNMIFPRLLLSKRLLTNDGFIFVSIDHHEIHNLISVMNEVYGEENFVSLIANINNPKGRSDDKFVATAHEYLLIYRKSDNSLLGGWTPGDNVLRRYNKIDTLGNRFREIDLRKTGDSDRRTDRPNMFYFFLFNKTSGDFYPTRDEIIPTGYIQIKPTKDDNTEGRWRWELDTSKENISRLFPKFMPIRKTWTIMEMDFLDPNEQIKPTTAWTKKDFNSERGSEQFIELGFKKEVFPRPKPVGLIKHILELATNPSTNDLILDFFAGSGTTAQAVMELNKIDGGNRQYLLVQYPEKIKSSEVAYSEGYRNIGEICKDRIRKASKIISSHSNELFNYDELSYETDNGFLGLKLGKSNFKEWSEPKEDNIIELSTLFTQFKNPLIESWKIQELLLEIILLQGFPIDSTFTRISTFDENAVDRINHILCAHQLYICLDENIADTTVETLSIRPEDIFVCMDTALTDEAKLRLSDRCQLKVI